MLVRAYSVFCDAEGCGRWVGEAVEARGEGASVVQLQAAARKGHLRLQTEMEGRRPVVTGAHLTPAGLRHLEMLDAALAEAQRRAALFASPVG